MIAQIRPAQFPAWLQAQGSSVPVVLDVREPWEVNVASIQPLSQASAFDVIFMPMQNIPQRMNDLPSDRPILCLCHHGIRSQQVAAYLLHHEFEQVTNLSGGIDAWSTELDANIPRY